MSIINIIPCRRLEPLYFCARDFESRIELIHLILHPQIDYTRDIQYFKHVPTGSMIPTNVIAYGRSIV